MRIDYDKLFTYQSGRTRFVGATITILGRAGRDFVIKANEAEIAENQSQIDLRGAVVITTSDGLKVETDNATYTESDGVTRAPGPVRFQRARMTGTSVGASYDRQRDVLWMLDQAHIVVAPDDKGTGAADVTAGAAGYAKRDRYIRFERERADEARLADPVRRRRRGRRSKPPPTSSSRSSCAARRRSPASARAPTASRRCGRAT